MTSKERVRLAMQRKATDRVPAAFEAVSPVWEKLMAHYNFKNRMQLYNKFDVDIIPTEPKYIGPELTSYIDKNGNEVSKTYWGYEETYYSTTQDKYGMTTYFPLKGMDTIEQIDTHIFPDADWFDYTPIKEVCSTHADKAIIIGHEGPFQIVTYLMEMDEFFMLMLDEPDVARHILRRINEFEMEYYKRCFEAGGGKIDILRTHDDYGTQQSLLFSADIWHDLFKENTEKLVRLAHRYDAYFMQHSCGAVRPLIESFIECDIDALEPVQKTQGLEIDSLAENFGGRITFHGGVDTQWLLPNGTSEEVAAQTRHIIETLGAYNGYILMASQGFENDVPIENIEAVYNVSRVVG